MLSMCLALHSNTASEVFVQTWWSFLAVKYLDMLQLTNCSTQQSEEEFHYDDLDHSLNQR